jgi:hypothetical protein
MLSRYLFGEPMSPGGVCPGEQVLPGPCLHNEHAHHTHTAEQTLAVSYVPLEQCSLGPGPPELLWRSLSSR